MLAAKGLAVDATALGRERYHHAAVLYFKYMFGRTVVKPDAEVKAEGIEPIQTRLPHGHGESYLLIVVIDEDDGAIGTVETGIGDIAVACVQTLN